MHERLQAYELMQRLAELPPQQEGFSFGALPSPWDPRDFRYERLVAVAEAPLPEEWSYRPNLPPAWDQGNLGTCVAASACWGVQAFDEVQQGDLPAQGLSVAFLYSECKRKDGIPNTPGTYPRVAMQVLQQTGVCPEEDMPYSVLTKDVAPFPQPSTETYSKAKQYRIKSYAALCSSSDANRGVLESVVNAVKAAIIREGPVMAALAVHDSFFYPKPPDYLIPVPQDEWIRGGHAVCLTGWSDAKGAFEMRNSWGASWGDGQGYAWLPYYWLIARRRYGWCCFEIWTTVDMVVPRAAKEIVLTIGGSLAVVDGKEIWLDQPAVVTARSRTLMPVRFVASNMGYLVDYTDGRVILRRPQEV